MSPKNKKTIEPSDASLEDVVATSMPESPLKEKNTRADGNGFGGSEIH
jgi:hypothetical protein